MTGYDEAVQRYFDAWNAGSPRERAAAVAAAFTEDGSYTDPMAQVRGHQELAALIDGVRTRFPGHDFTLTGSPEGHHAVARFRWDLVAVADGSSPAAGSDVITLAEDGRISSVTGFLDRLPG